MSATRKFDTSWGAVLLPDNQVRFRIWGSLEKSIKLRIKGQDLESTPDQEGWREWVLEGILPGTSYSYVIDGELECPDPVARAQHGAVNGPSVVVDPAKYQWRHTDWQARPWEETVYYELHVGTFTPQGTFASAAEKLEYLRDLGITTIEIMPVGQFAGERGWGYDGVLIYAPHTAYGTPEDMKAFIDAAHGLGLNVVLDVIYNHFGPEGNYLPTYAPDFFHPERHTPWGAAIAYEKEPVREFFIENALYWLEEYNLDGLRLDAVDHIRDEESDPELLVEIGQRIRQRWPDRRIHLTTEDNRNITSLHERDEDGRIKLYSGEWNDDFHNVAHMIATGESESYYADFVERHWWKMARALAEGFVYQGEPTTAGEQEGRGVPSGHLPPTAFVDFIQNHDQVGNRAFGERLTDLAEASMVETLLAMLLLSPHIPLLFMGEEWGETRPFTFFTDFHGELADAVREGRRKEFAGFEAFSGGEESLKNVPDPNAESTFQSCKLNWAAVDSGDGRERLELVRQLLRLRREHIIPLLADTRGYAGKIEQAEDGLVSVSWRLNGAVLHMAANLDNNLRPARAISGMVIYASSEEASRSLAESGELPPHNIVVALQDEPQRMIVLP
ncbi:MAG TPA: malto-oligosyltrehalose trehalohydrolase [Devosia sp.]|nr:malto-oligosyltrehalose trehalohydrolase [Devosia sp.]